MSDLFVLATGELVEGSSVAISGSTAASGLPLTNLLTKYPFEKWRSSNLTTVYMEIDLAAAADVYGLWLGYTNFRPGVTQWRVRAATSQANLTAAPDYDSGTVYALAQASYDSTTYATDWPNGTHALLYAGSAAWSSLANKRWWRIDLTDAAHPDGYFQAGRLILAGASWKPAVGPSYGSEVPGEQVSASATRTVSGHLFPTIQPTPAFEQFQFRDLTFSEVSSLRNLCRKRGSHKDVLSLWAQSGQTNVEHTTLHGFVRSVDTPSARFFDTYSADVEIQSAAG